MSEPFLGEIIMFGGNFAPRGWAFCDGQLLPISQYSALFSILGTTYGGDGRTTFGLPDLRGRLAIGPRNGPGLSDYRLGEKGGSETNTLGTHQIPSHGHTTTLKASSDESTLYDPTNAVLTNSGARDAEYGPATNLVNMSNASIVSGNTGGGQPVNNLQPLLAVNYIIALQGLYPPRS